VALNPPSTRFAVLMVVRLADEVARAAGAVDVAIECAAAEAVSMVVFSRMMFSKSSCIRRRMDPRQSWASCPSYLSPR
jgi:hypothetical protein